MCIRDRISTCATPTVSLVRAQEMLAEAREETRAREQQMMLNEEDEDQMLWEQQQKSQHSKTDSNKDDRSNVHDDMATNDTQRASDDDGALSTPNLSSYTGTTATSNGFASPYLLASGVLSPKVGRSNSTRVTKDHKKEEFIHGERL